MAKNTQRDKDSLAIGKPEAFLRRERAAQRAGIWLLTLFAAAGAAGLFGSGPLASTTITGGDTTIRFERFARQTFRTELEVSVAGASAPAINITLPRGFLDNVDLLEVRPAGSLKQLDEERVMFEVPASGGAATLVLHYEPKNYGVLEVDVTAGERPPVHLRQIVFF